MVAGTGHDIGCQDRRCTLGISPAGGLGNAKGVRRALVFWLTLLFSSFALFAPPNFTSAATLTLCALAVSGAVGMILELEQGLGGLIHISPQPMLQAVMALGG